MLEKTLEERLVELENSKNTLNDAHHIISWTWKYHQVNVISTELRKLLYKSRTNTPLFLDLCEQYSFSPKIFWMFLDDEFTKSTLMEGLVFHIPWNWNIFWVDWEPWMQEIYLKDFLEKYIIVLWWEKFKAIEIISFIANKYWAHSDLEIEDKLKLLNDLKFWNDANTHHYYNLFFYNFAFVMTYKIDELINLIRNQQKQ